MDLSRRVLTLCWLLCVLPCGGDADVRRVRAPSIDGVAAALRQDGHALISRIPPDLFSAAHRTARFIQRATGGGAVSIAFSIATRKLAANNSADCKGVSSRYGADVDACGYLECEMGLSTAGYAKFIGAMFDIGLLEDCSSKHVVLTYAQRVNAALAQLKGAGAGCLQRYAPRKPPAGAVHVGAGTGLGLGIYCRAADGNETNLVGGGGGGGGGFVGARGAWSGDSGGGGGAEALAADGSFPKVDAEVQVADVNRPEVAPLVQDPNRFDPLRFGKAMCHTVQSAIPACVAAGGSIVARGGGGGGAWFCGDLLTLQAGADVGSGFQFSVNEASAYDYVPSDMPSADVYSLATTLEALTATAPPSRKPGLSDVFATLSAAIAGEWRRAQGRGLDTPENPGQQRDLQQEYTQAFLPASQHGAGDKNNTKCSTAYTA